MRISKNIFAKAILIFPAFLALAACNLPTPKDKKGSGNDAATFTAQAMADRSKAIEEKVQGSFALPSSKIFNLQACIKDVAFDKNVSGHDFVIVELNQKITSDKSGCITWTEQINYNYLGESQYLRIERTIKGTGLHKGTQTVSFAINPWSHGENLAPVLNPEDGNKIPSLIDDSTQGGLALKGLSKDNKPLHRSLWVEEARLFITEQNLTQNGVDLFVELRPSVSIQLTKMNGELVLRGLTAGTFKTKIKLIHTYQNGTAEIRRVLAESALLIAPMENGSLAIKSKMRLSSIPTRGQVVLGLELLPEDGPQGLTQFDGIYHIGEYDQIKGSSFLKLHHLVTQSKSFKVADYATTSTADLAAGNKTGKISEEDNYQKPKVEVAQLEFRYNRVGEERTATREVFYNVKACLKNGIDQKNLRSQTFEVTKFRSAENDSRSTVLVKTDNNSCINWDESITFKYFDCQHNFKGFVTIKNDALGMNEKLEVLVNPWEPLGLMGRDLRYVDKNEKLVLSCEKENRQKTQLVIDGYSYNTLSYQYGVDSLLNLTVTKKIQFKMEPHLLVYSNLANGRGTVERLRDGVYLLKLAVVQNRDYETTNSYVTSAEKLVTVLSGQINADITFQTQDLKALGNRNNMLIELYPVDENKVLVQNGGIALKNPADSLSSAIDGTTGLVTPTFIGPVTLNVDEASRPVRMLDASAINQYLLKAQTDSKSDQIQVIQKVVSEGLQLLNEKRQKMKGNAEKTQFAKDNNLELIGLKNLKTNAPLVESVVGSTDLTPQLQITRDELKTLAQTGSLSAQAAKKLCAFWSKDYFKKLNAEKGGTLQKNELGFGYDCYYGVAKDPKSFFQVQKKLLIKEVGGTRYMKGTNQGLTVGTSFSLSTSHSKSENKSVSVGIKAGLSKKFLDIASIGADVGYSMTWTASDSKSSSNSIGVNGATSLTVQQSEMKIRVNKYESCAIVNLNPKLFMKSASWFARTDYLSSLNPRLNEAEMAAAVTRGLMVCDDETQVAPLDITENYFLITQESNSAQMQDMGDARNRNLFIALRSKNDFQRFVIAMKGKTGMPQTATKEEDPQAQAVKMMEQLFELPGASHPGVYLVE